MHVCVFIYIYIHSTVSFTSFVFINSVYKNRDRYLCLSNIKMSRISIERVNRLLIYYKISKIIVMYMAKSNFINCIYKLREYNCNEKL